jgi:hypothetical protein
MKSIYALQIRKELLLMVILTLFPAAKSFSQAYVTWNPATSTAGVSGTFPGGTVTATLTGGGFPVSFDSPALDDTNLVVSGNRTFSTNGPNSSAPSQSLTFTFSTPVIVTRYNMVDIDLGEVWDDTFDFAGGFSFASSTDTNCTATTTGAAATSDVSSNGEFAYWFCSGPVTTFTLDYAVTGGLTHAYLGYSVQIFVPPTMDAICQNSTPPAFPTIGSGIPGTWSPSTINTSIIGTTNYVFTPNIGQALQCPITMEVTIADCCPATLTSSAPITTMVQQERLNWIDSSDFVTFGDGIVGNGVVYHAGDYVDLTPGFEAVTGSQFAAYPLGCTGGFNYRIASNGNQDIPKTNQNTFAAAKSNIISIVMQDSQKSVKITTPNLNMQSLSIFTIEGKKVTEKSINDGYTTEIDISNLATGVYIVNVATKVGAVFSEKFIKN